jgi:LysM repeat protein
VEARMVASPARPDDRIADPLATRPPNLLTFDRTTSGGAGFLTDSLNPPRAGSDPASPLSIKPVGGPATTIGAVPPLAMPSSLSPSVEPEKNGITSLVAPASSNVLSPGVTIASRPEAATVVVPPLAPAPKPDAPMPMTVPPSAANGRPEHHTVAEGDTMWTLAQAWFGDGGRWDLIAKANPLIDPERLTVGQKLVLPPKDAQRPESSLGFKPSGPAAASTVAYTVAAGDTLRKIARTYYGDPEKWKLIYDTNRAVLGGDPHTMRVGMKLVIPPAPTPAGAAGR